MNKNPDFWKEMAEQVIMEEIPDRWQFDTLIVDEGQDFEQEWADILRLFLKKDGDILWLEDDNQNLGEKKPIKLDGFVTYHSNANYRSPESISHYIKKNLPFEFDIAKHIGKVSYDNLKERREHHQGWCLPRSCPCSCRDDV
jgi:hypothetical protein